MLGSTNMFTTELCNAEKEMRTLRLAIIFLFLSCFAILSEEASLSNCSSYSNDNERLICYDSLSSYNHEEKIETPITSNWKYNEVKDVFTDEYVSELYLEREQGSYGGMHSPDFLYIKCDGKGNYNIYLEIMNIVKAELVNVKYRFGKQDLVFEKWETIPIAPVLIYPNHYKKNNMVPFFDNPELYKDTDHSDYQDQSSPSVSNEKNSQENGNVVSFAELLKSGEDFVFGVINDYGSLTPESYAKFNNDIHPMTDFMFGGCVS